MRGSQSLWIKILELHVAAGGGLVEVRPGVGDQVLRRVEVRTRIAQRDGRGTAVVAHCVPPKGNTMIHLGQSPSERNERSRLMTYLPTFIKSRRPKSERPGWARRFIVLETV
jgi:hypothetical protein